jgi:uncharacterized protein
MLLDLGRLRRGGERVDRTEAPSAFAFPENDFRLVAPVHLTADVRKDGDRVRLTGRVVTTVGLDCSRCLEAYSIPVDVPFDLLLLPASANRGEGEREVAEEDLGVSFYKDEVIDLGEVIREQVYLALPMKPLCREDCQGLCPVCGRNRNREACSCEHQWVDPRMEPLRNLRKH